MRAILSSRDGQLLDRAVAVLERRGPTVLVGFIVVLTLKQIAVNALGQNRHLVAAVVEGLAVALIATGMWLIVLRWGRHGMPNVLTAVVITQTLLIVWWTVVLLLGPGGTAIQRLVSLGFDAGATCLIWFPIAVVSDDQAARRLERALLVAVAWLLLVGMLQYVLGPERLPRLLQGDATVALSGTTLGTSRVNGLVGTSIDYGFIMLVAGVVAFASLLRGPNRFSAAATGGCLIGIIISGSRAAELLMVASALLLPIVVGSNAPNRIRFLVSLGAAIPILLFLYATKAYLTAASYLGLQTSAYGKSDTVRFADVSRAVQGVIAHPILGTGIGYQNAPLFGGSATHKVITDGFWWAVMLEGGVLGLVLLMALYAALTRTLWRGNTLGRSGWAVLGVVIIAATTIYGFVNSSLDNQSVNLGVYVILGMCVAASNPEWYREVTEPSTAMVNG